MVKNFILPYASCVDVDFIAANGTFVFNATTRELSTIVTILTDDVVEFSETFLVGLSSNDSSVNLVRNSTVITILDSTS